jgi:hypothetical protein
MMIPRTFRSWLLAGMLAAASFTCGGDTASPNVEPAALEPVSGNGQIGLPGQLLHDPLVVLVKDGQGQPLQGVAVTWSAADGGSVSQSSVPTGSDGRASVQWTLGQTAGQETASAVVSGLSPVQFTAIAGAGSGVTLVVTPPSSALDHEVFRPDQQPAVVVADDNGAPAAGVTVTATLASGGGGLEGTPTATTGADGRAAFGDLGLTGSGAQTIKFTAGTQEVVSGPVTVTPLPAAATSGAWGPVVDWSANGADIVPLQMHLLPTGKVLAWGRAGQPWVWTPPADGDPAGAGSFQEFPVDTMLFCAGHAFLPDGRLLVSGGHFNDDQGLEVTHTFDPFSERWSARGELPDMHSGRWYPTVTILPDGRAVTVAGRDKQDTVIAVPELWDGSQWVQLTGAAKAIPYYPRDFVAPNGLVFYAGERVQSWWLDVNANGGTGGWTAGPSHVWNFNRDYGSAVMYAPGKILYAGGGGHAGTNNPHDATSAAPTNTAELIDLNDANPQWRSTASMQYARRHLNATMLPDGDVLVTGGLSAGGFNTLAGAVHVAELWSPATGQWTQLASNAVDRGYHAVSLLLPDGAVLHGASGDANAPPGEAGAGSAYPRQTNHEIFSPPYLFKGNRPTIDGISSPEVGYGQSFAVQTAYAAQITRVSLVRLGSVTHAFDQNGRFLELQFSRGSSGLSVTAPANPNLAPPGHYLLFVLNRNGVPSAAKVIRLR